MSLTANAFHCNGRNEVKNRAVSRKKIPFQDREGNKQYCTPSTKRNKGNTLSKYCALTTNASKSDTVNCLARSDGYCVRRKPAEKSDCSSGSVAPSKKRQSLHQKMQMQIDELTRQLRKLQAHQTVKSELEQKHKTEEDDDSSDCTDSE